MPISFPSEVFDKSYFIDFDSLKSDQDLALTELEMKHQPQADKYTEKFINTYIAIQQQSQKEKQKLASKYKEAEDSASGGEEEMLIPTFEEMGLTTKIIYFLLVIGMLGGVIVGVKKILTPNETLNDELKRKKEEKKSKKQKQKAH